MNNTKIKYKLITDILLTVALLLLMSYELLGSAAHEAVGIVMFVLFLFHHIFNKKQARYLIKGKQTPIRIFQSIMVLLVLVSFVASIISGVAVSRHLFAFLNIKSNYAANRIHMLSAYWGFVFMSLHLGIHFNVIFALIKNKSNLSKGVKAVLKIACALLFFYGMFCFFKRDILGYLLLKNQFFILGDNEFLPLYIFDYFSVMFSLSMIAHYVSLKLRKVNK